MNGINYIPSPKEEYDGVMAFSVPAEGTTIPSGATIVRGIYYKWNERGFIGQGWMYNIPGGPTGMYPHFNSEADVAAHVAEHQNLDKVFEHWSQYYTLEGWDTFYNAVGATSGCVDVAHSA